MQAVILAGGRGTRLRPITDLVPKPLVPINNRPIIEWQLAYLKGAGIADVIISSGYRSRQIENFLRGKGDCDIRIRYSAEEEPLGTGGAIRRAAPMITGDSFVVINGDVITDIDILRLQKRANCIAAIQLRTKFGVLDTDGSRVTDFLEKQVIDGIWMNAGVYHLSADMSGGSACQGGHREDRLSRVCQERQALSGAVS